MGCSSCGHKYDGLGSTQAAPTPKVVTPAGQRYRIGSFVPPVTPPPATPPVAPKASK